ncbi:acetylxylan esterase [Pelobium manganitolerans]|uniref:Acetylxylan esterase n=1 Tax=Pelobium manganitolerans TaxID=1842495 RepID=A0A419S740_9SPHI|nr:sialate O-acetylesterase [Pelobium manganitolerans]RKD17130.1 acetylxylan esterase [Pelobium manganitolerans]
MCKSVYCIIFFFLVSANSVFAQLSGGDKNLHLYLLIGQSNMAGRGVVDAESKEVNPRILMLDSLGQWVPATDPMHFDNLKLVGVGPGIAFAKEMLANNSNIKIGLIPCAWGGSPIKVWRPGAKYFKARPYDDAITRTKLAMSQGVLKGILWHQGESDNDSLKSSRYMASIEQLIQHLREDLEMPKIPFIAGEIGYFNKRDFINPVINQLPNKVNQTAVVSAVGLTDKGDRLHFDTPSARELGKRYAIAMNQLQKIQR